MTGYPQTTLRLFALLPGAALVASACSGLAAAPAPTPVKEPTAVEASPAPATTREVDQQRIADLELRLLEKGAQVEELQARLDDARREVVRAMAKLQSLATRAEAASGIAEAELALQSLSPTTTAEATAETRQLMAQSSGEFNKENYAGALYLANQAKNAATAAHGQLAREDGSRRSDERSLALPLRLETTTSANVRGGPGVQFAVLFTLPARTHVVAYSSAEQWLRIADDSGRRGWISQTLIRGQP